MLAGAPISWGVCEVPGWGRMLDPDRVFAEMASLGLTATELGPIGYLPFEPAAIRERLDRHGLRLVGGFVPLVLHTEDLGPARESADRIARVLAGAGADVFVAAVVADDAWSPPVALDDAAWTRLARHLGEIERAGRRATASRSRCTPTSARRSRRARTSSGCSRSRTPAGASTPATC